MKLQANEMPRFLALFDRDHGFVLPDQRKWLEYKWVITVILFLGGFCGMASLKEW
jgi:hypothetical protein